MLSPQGNNAAHEDQSIKHGAVVHAIRDVCCARRMFASQSTVTHTLPSHTFTFIIIYYWQGGGRSFILYLRGVMNFVYFSRGVEGGICTHVFSQSLQSLVINNESLLK